MLFVGSGVSMWSQLPSWSGLIEELSIELRSLGREAEVVDRERTAGDLMLAASYGMDQMTPPERARFFRRVIDTSKRPSELHRELARLGPKCFVTTNYDQLLERALERDGNHIDVVTPNNTLELPSIVQARATGFVFKPHGDISNSETIVFTREDYRELVGSRRAVFEAMSMLFASRPVVFIGFGLRDPDFLQMRDRLFGAFQSNPADHFAIMANVLNEERAYWRKHHGINLVSYEMIAGVDGLDAHRPLLALVRELKATVKQAKPLQDEASDLLDLARYARGLSVEYPEVGDSDIALKLSAMRTGDQQEWSTELKLRGEAVEALAGFRGRLVIEGSPGAGKSHVVRRTMGALASRLLADTLSSHSPGLKDLRVPILVQLRDYRGDLMSMLRDQLPSSVSLEKLIEARATSIFLDGLNEVPEHEKNMGRLAGQLQELFRIAPGNNVFVTTRTHSPIDGLDIEKAVLDAVTESEVMERLAQSDVALSSVSPPILDLLRRPLFFRAWLGGAFDVTSVTSIHGSYLQILGKFDDALSHILGTPWTVVSVLGAAAARMIDEGGLTAEVAEIERVLASSLPQGADVDQVLNSFLEQGLLVPTSKRRLAFYHHSITEYAAAHYVAERIKCGDASALTYLGHGAWDHTLLLTLGFLDAEISRAVHDAIMRADPALGLRGLHFIEHDQSRWVQRALSALPELLEESAAQRLWISLDALPVGVMHTNELEVLAEFPDRIGGEALGILARMHRKHLDEAIDAIVSGHRGYNYLTELARHLRSQVDDDLVEGLLQKLGSRAVSSSVEEELFAGTHEGELLATVVASEELLGDVGDQFLIDASEEHGSIVVGAVVIRSLANRRTAKAVSHVRTVIEKGQGGGVFAHYMQLSYGSPQEGFIPTPSKEFLGSLLRFLHHDRHAQWALATLKLYADMDLASIESLRNGHGANLEALLLTYASGRLVEFNKKIIAFVESGVDWSAEPVAALAAIEGWTGPAVMALLETRDVRVANAVLSSIHAIEASKVQVDLPNLAAWVDWLREQDREKSYLSYLIGDFLATCTTEPVRREIIFHFSAVPEDRRLVSGRVLSRVADLSLDEFDSESVNWLVERACEPHEHWEGHLIARLATEETVEEHLLPMFANKVGAERRAVGSVLLEIGARLGRRYVNDDGMTLLMEC